MRIKSCLRIALTALLLAAAVRQATAVVVVIQLTKDFTTEDRSFKVETQDVDGLKQLKVTYTFDKTAGKYPPWFGARLDMIMAGKLVASVPVEVFRSRGKVTWSFRVSPESLADSKFEFDQGGSGVVTDPQGNPSRDESGDVEFLPDFGGTKYWFYLRDFAGPKGR